MMKEYQVTLINNTGEYKPISCIINNDQIDDSDWTLDKDNKKQGLSEERLNDQLENIRSLIAFYR